MTKIDIKWNNNLKVIITDVDDTVAEIFKSATDEVINELNKVLSEGKIIFFISGQGIHNIYSRVISHLDKKYMKQVLVGHCNGSEIYQFDDNGDIVEEPIFSVCNLYSENLDKTKMKAVVNEILEHFSLIPLPPMPLEEFKLRSENKPNYIMLDNRNVQISIDFVNTIDSCKFKNIDIENNESRDIRQIVAKEAEKIIAKYDIPIESCIAGTCAIDFIYKGVEKGLPIRHLIKFGKEFKNDLPNQISIGSENEIEVWGDSFSGKNASDRKMSYALPKEIRSISFREINEKIKDGYNVVEWNGEKRLNEGLLEFLFYR